MGMDIAKTIPFAGTAITAIEEIIGLLWEPFKEMRQEARVDAINFIIQQKIATDDDISAIVGKLAL